MKSLLSLLLVPLLLLSSLAHEIDVRPSVPAGGLIVARAKGEEEAKGFVWLVIDPAGQMMVDSPYLFRDPRIPDTIVISGGEGKYQIMLMTSMKDGTLEQSFASVIRGKDVPPVVVPPPDVVIPPPPPPDVVVPATGPRNILVVWESGESTPYISALNTQVRTGAFNTYLKEKGHRLEWLDDDLIDRDGKPAPSVEAWRPFFKDLPLPAVIITDPKTRTIIKRESILDPVTKRPHSAAALLEMIKASGG
jgi:hypothetical protein